MAMLSKSNYGPDPRFADPRIIQFRPRAQPSKVTLPPIVDPVRQFELAESRLRMQQNLAATLVLLFLVGAGLWLFNELRTSSRILTCLEAGHRNCLPIDQTSLQANR